MSKRRYKSMRPATFLSLMSERAVVLATGHVPFGTDPDSPEIRSKVAESIRTGERLITLGNGRVVLCFGAHDPKAEEHLRDYARAYHGIKDADMDTWVDYSIIANLFAEPDVRATFLAMSPYASRYDYKLLARAATGRKD